MLQSTHQTYIIRIYVYKYVYLCVYTHICVIYVYYIRIFVCIYVQLCVYTYICVYKYLWEAMSEIPGVDLDKKMVESDHF